MFYDEAVSIDRDGLLRFKQQAVHREPKLFYLNAARDYFVQPEGEANPLLYAFYERNYLDADEDLFRRHSLNYNLKLVRPGLVKNEYFKSVPHFHVQDALTEETYPEIHEILEGEGVFLLQKNRSDGGAREALAIPFTKGDHIYIKNGFGHSTINTGEGPLLIASLINRKSERDYMPFPQRKGSLYFLLRGEDGRPEYVKNDHYDESIGLEILTPPDLDQPVSFTGGLYEAYTEKPERFSILCK